MTGRWRPRRRPRHDSTGGTVSRRAVTLGLAVVIALGGAGAAMAEPGNGLGPRDGETGPRCSEALAHAAEQGIGDQNPHRNDALARAAENCAEAGPPTD